MDNIASLSQTYHLIGHAYLYMDTVYYLAPLEEDMLAIINDHGVNKGALKISVVPSIEGVDFEEFETLKELTGKELSLGVRIFEAAGIPDNYSTNVFCKYSIAALNSEEFKTDEVKETTTNPRFNYSKVHKLMVNPELTDDFLNRALTISVFGDITEAKKLREIEKLKESINKSTAMKLNKSVRDYDETPMGGKALGDNLTSGGPIILMQKDEEDASFLKTELEIKEQQLQKIKAEQLKREADYNKRIKELEERERNVGIVVQPQRGSSCCVTF